MSARFWYVGSGAFTGLAAMCFMHYPPITGAIAFAMSVLLYEHGKRREGIR